MYRNYKFENVVFKGRRYAFTVKNATSFGDAKKKAVNWCINKLNLDKSEFGKHMDYLNKNIENGETRVTPLKNEIQDTFDFDKVYEQLYTDLLKRKIRR